MAPDNGLGDSIVRRVMVATDRSETADRATHWAASLAELNRAELLLVQVVAPGNPDDGDRTATDVATVERRLAAYAEQLAGPRGLAIVAVDDDPSAALLRVAQDADVDTLVVGNVGMSGRKEFLLGNIPNRISHNARCNVIIVNTAVDGDGQTVARVVKPQPDVTEPRLMARSAFVATTLARQGIAEISAKRSGSGSRQSDARRLKEALEELGPTFAKLGQVLSTRPDLMPPEFIDELAKLQDDVAPLSEAEVVEVMEQELGVPWEDVFESIDPVPLAAGTIAQVHRATLEDGSRVVVKVQRPTARVEITEDLALLGLFAERTKNRPLFREIIDVPAVFAHLSESLERELDFEREAANIRRMRTILAQYSRLAVPDVYDELSTRRMLVMQEVRGTPVRQAPDGDARTEAARQLLESYYRQILTEGFFHADPHPGNMMWWKDRIYFLDFGMVGELGPELRENMMLLLMAFWQEDVGFLADVTLMLGESPDRSDIDVEAFRGELGLLLAKYRNVSLADIQLGPILQEMTEIAIRHQVPLPASLALTAKALAQMQQTAAELDPDLDPFEVAGNFLMRSMTGHLRERIDPKRIFYEAQKLRVRVTRLIEALERLSGAKPGPKLQVNFRAERLEDVVHQAGRRLSLGATASAALLAAARLAGTSRVARSLPMGLGTIGSALAVRLLIDLLRTEESGHGKRHGHVSVH